MKRFCTNCGFDGADAAWFDSPFAEAPDHSEATHCAHEWGLEMEAELPPRRHRYTAIGFIQQRLR